MSADLPERVPVGFESQLSPASVEDRIEWFSDLLRRRPDENATAWSMRVLESWVPIFNGLQASLYWLTETETSRELHLLNSYACDRQQLRHEIGLGEGLIGQAARSSRLIYLDDRSRFKPTTTTNLSAIQPAAYLVAPLVYNQVVEGVMEMTLINPLTEQELAQLRRMGNQLAASLRALRNEEVTRQLYAQMQQKNEELTVQDEEMRQNLEEMQATQEELRRTKDELERRQHQFELIASNIPGALLQLHEFPEKEQKIVRYASRRFRDLFGLDPEAVIGQDIMGLLEVHPDDLDTFAAADEASFSGGDFTMQLRVKTEYMPDYRWLQFQGFVADQKDGSFISDIYIEDIQQRKEQERELAIKTEVFTSSNDSIWILDGPTIIDCNEASPVLFGTEGRSSMIGTTPFRWSPEFQPCGTPSDELAAIRIHKAMTEGFNEFEWVHMRASGEIFDCEVRLNRIVIGDKVLLSAFHRDISHRKTQERELAIKSEVFVSSNVAIWILDGPQIIDCNEASVKMFGVSSQKEILGTTPFQWSPELQPSGSSSVGLAGERIQQALTSGFVEFEWVHRKANGELFDCEIRLTRIDFGEKVLISAFISDISNRKQKEREILSLQHQYQQFLDRLDQAVFIVKTNGSPYFANRRAIELLGKGIDPSASKSDLTQVYPAYKMGTDMHYPTDELPVVRALSGEDTVIDDMEIETPMGRKRIRVHGFPIHDEANEIKYAMCTFDLIAE